MDDLRKSLKEYNEQLSLVNDSLANTQDVSEKDSLLALQSELRLLIQLTKESLDTVTPKELPAALSETANNNERRNEIDDEYALFIQEMAETGAYESFDQDAKDTTNESQLENNEDSDIEDELSTLLGMKCAVYHTHKWGGQPSLHNAMVSTVLPRQDDDDFKDLQVCVLFTHPTHAEMLPCPFYLEGECKFSDDKCRYSHGKVVQLSDLKDALEPNFESIKVGSRILLKLKPPKDEDITVAKKSTEKYHLWHRAIVLSVDFDKMTCVVKLESGVKTGDKRKLSSDEYHVSFEEIFPLNLESGDSDSSDGSLSDTEYSESKVDYSQPGPSQQLVVDNIPQHVGPPIGEWERHTRGIGSKLMLAMGYVPGTGLGASSAGRVQPVEARLLPHGRSLDHCMEISNNAQDPLKVEQRLRKLQKKEEERNKRAYEREKEKERRNVFNFLNRTLGNESGDPEPSKVAKIDVKQSTSKDLNIEQFKITEDTKKLEKELKSLNSSIAKYPSGSEGHRQLNIQITEKNRELSLLKTREKQISQEQNHRKNKQSMLF